MAAGSREAMPADKSMLASKVFMRSRLSALFLLLGLAISLILFSTAAQTTIMYEKQGASVLEKYPWDAYLEINVSEAGLRDLPRVLAEASTETGAVETAFQAFYILNKGGSMVEVFVLDNHTYDAAGFAGPCTCIAVNPDKLSSVLKGCVIVKGDPRTMGLNERIREALGGGGLMGLGYPAYIVSDTLVVFRGSSVEEASKLLADLRGMGYSYPSSKQAPQPSMPPSSSKGTTVIHVETPAPLGMATIYIRFNRDKYFHPTDIDGSIRRLRSLIQEFKVALSGKGYMVLGEGNISGELSEIRFFQTLTRISSVLSELPGIIIVGIVATEMPKIIIVRARRLAALLKARGVDDKSLSRGILYAATLWIAVGSLAGYLSGILVAALPSRYSPGRALGLVDPLSTAVFLAVALVVPLLAARRSISIVSNIPVRLLEQDVLGEEEIVGRLRAGRLAWISLGLGLYYAATRITGVSPMNYLSSASGKPLLMLLLLLLLSIDGFVEYLGPVFLAYGAAKIAASNKRVLEALVGSVARMAGEYREAASRLASSKPYRIALVVIIASFAIGSSVSGIVSSSAARAALERSVAVGIGAEAAGYRAFNSLNASLSEAEALLKEASASREPILVALYTNTSLCGCSMSLAYGPGKYGLDGILVVLNPGSMAKAMLLPERLGGSGEASRIASVLSKGSYIYLHPTAPGEKPGGVEGRAVILIGSPSGTVNKTIYVAFSTDGMPGSYLVGKYIAGSMGMGEASVLSPLQVMKLYVLPHQNLLVAPSSIEGILPSNARYVVVAYTGRSGGELLAGRGYRVVYGWVEAKKFAGSLSYLWYSFRTVVMSGVILLVVAVAIASAAAYLAIDENSGAYAAMRARGVGTGSIARMINAEILAPSLLSALIGFLIGVAGGLGSVKRILEAPMMRSIVSVYLGRVPIIIDPVSIALSIAAAIPIVIAALATGYYALRGPVGEALRRSLSG